MYNNGLCIISVYNNVNMSVVGEGLKEEVEKARKGFENVIICGDLNARIGLNQMYVEDEEGEGNVAHRSSQDATINENGKYLIKLAEELELILFNGRASGDKDGIYRK